MKKYILRLYINNIRITFAKLNGIDSRFFYMFLKELIKKFESRYGEKLNENSILISINGKEIYREKKRLLKSGIKTISDLLEYLEIQNPKSIILNNNVCENLSLKINDVYVLEVTI